MCVLFTLRETILIIFANLSFLEHLRKITFFFYTSLERICLHYCHGRLFFSLFVSYRDRSPSHRRRLTKRVCIHFSFSDAVRESARGALMKISLQGAAHRTLTSSRLENVLHDAIFAHIPPHLFVHFHISATRLSLCF